MSQKMSSLAIINSENFNSGTIKRPDAVMLAATASGIDPVSLLPVFTFQKHSIRIGKFSPEEIVLFVFDKTETDKTVTTINQIVTLSLSKMKAWQSDSLFSSAQSAKLALACSKKLADYPVILLSQVGLYPADKVIPVLSAILSAKYDFKSQDADNTAMAMVAYAVERPALASQPLTKILGYIETEAMRSNRLTEYQTKQAKKLAAAGAVADDKF
jgi:hypothetical protein